MFILIMSHNLSLFFIVASMQICCSSKELFTWTNRSIYQKISYPTILTKLQNDSWKHINSEHHMCKILIEIWEFLLNKCKIKVLYLIALLKNVRNTRNHLERALFIQVKASLIQHNKKSPTRNGQVSPGWEFTLKLVTWRLALA